MLYYLFEFFEKQYNLTGASLFQYISFQSINSGNIFNKFLNAFWQKIHKIFKEKTNR